MTSRSTDHVLSEIKVGNRGEGSETTCTNSRWNMKPGQKWRHKRNINKNNLYLYFIVHDVHSCGSICLSSVSPQLAVLPEWNTVTQQPLVSFPCFLKKILLLWMLRVSAVPLQQLKQVMYIMHSASHNRERRGTKTWNSRISSPSLRLRLFRAMMLKLQQRDDNLWSRCDLWHVPTVCARLSHNSSHT